MWFLGIIGIIISIFILPFIFLYRLKEWYDQESIKRKEIKSLKREVCNYEGCTRNAYSDNLHTCHTCHLKYCREHISSFNFTYYSECFYYCKYHYNDYRIIEKDNNERMDRDRKEENARIFMIKMAEGKYLAEKESNPSIHRCYERDCYVTDVIKCSSPFCNNYICNHHNVHYEGLCYSCFDCIDS